MDSKVRLHKLGRKKSHREALKRNLLTSLVLYENVRTTKAKAKAIVPLFDKLMKEAKRDTHLAGRSLQKMLYDVNAVRKVTEVLKDRFKDDNSGLVRMYRVGRRKGDNAEMVQLMIKGYVYKDIGTKSRKQQKTKDKKVEEDREQKIDAAKEISQTSQVKPTAVQGKARSRSGI